MAKNKTGHPLKCVSVGGKCFIFSKINGLFDCDTLGMKLLTKSVRKWSWSAANRRERTKKRRNIMYYKTVFPFWRKKIRSHRISEDSSIVMGAVVFCAVKQTSG